MLGRPTSPPTSPQPPRRSTNPRKQQGPEPRGYRSRKPVIGISRYEGSNPSLSVSYRARARSFNAQPLGLSGSNHCASTSLMQEICERKDLRRSSCAVRDGSRLPHNFLHSSFGSRGLAGRQLAHESKTGTLLGGGMGPSTGATAVGSPCPVANSANGVTPLAAGRLSSRLAPRQRGFSGGGTPSWRQIARTVPAGISRWRGTGARRSRSAVDQIAWFAPSRMTWQAYVRRCASRSRRFTSGNYPTPIRQPDRS
jgi:hypothetical protein